MPTTTSCRVGTGASGYVDDDHDRERFLNGVSQTVERYYREMLSYVLMGNHFYFPLRTPKPNLSKKMHAPPENTVLVNLA